MENRPLFSVLICTVGKPELVKCAIKSVLNQTLQSFEIVVTDTSGTNLVRDAVSLFKDVRLKFFEVPDKDPSISWDFAYDQSTGEYVLWFDDDNCLVNFALERFNEIIKKEKPDIVSGNHVYYYGRGNRHNPGLENALGVLLPFSFKYKIYNPEDMLSAVYDLSVGSKKMPARWHSAATFIARSLCEKVKERTGEVMTRHLLANFHFHPLFFAYAKKPIYDDRPLSVIGKFSSSITQQWSNTYAKQEERGVLPFRFTGLTAKTGSNTNCECYLQAQRLIPEKLAKYELNLPQFYKNYLNDLMLIDLPFKKHLFYWLELWKIVDRLEKNSRRKIHFKVLRAAAVSFIIYLLRNLGVWDAVRKLRKKFITENPNRKFVKLDAYGINSIEECALQLKDIMKKEFGLEIRNEPQR